VTNNHKTADCLAEVARLKQQRSSESPDELYKRYRDLVEKISPNLSTGDAEEIFYIMLVQMFTQVGFVEHVERIYNNYMASNYNW
jgi:hypothetical protein